MGIERNDESNKGVLNFIEKVGNALPHPVVLFIIMIFTVMVIAHITYLSGVSLSYFDATAGEEVLVEARTMFNFEGLRYIFNNAVSNFMGFSALGVVILAMLGVGVAEWTGLIAASLKKLVSNVPPFLLSAAIVFAGVMSSIAADVGYVVIIPLGAIIFAGAGRHPIAGLAAAFAGVSGGFSANLFVGPIDALVVGIINDALASANIAYEVNVAANWYFIIFSTFMLTIVGAIVTDKIVEPRLGEYTGDYMPDNEPLNLKEEKGLKWALIVFLIYMIIMGILMFGPNAPFKTLNEVTGQIDLNEFLGDGLLLAIFFLFTLPGLTYGIIVGKIKTSADFVKGMTEAIASISGMIVLVFFAAQLINYFDYTNLGTLIAVGGANFLRDINLSGIPLVIGFIIITSIINLFIGGAVTKWVILAPIFAPMFYSLDIAPEVTLMAYRIADSSTNIISPLMSFMPIILIMAQKYDKNSGLGTIISTMFSYSMAFLLGWSVILIGWLMLGIPLGV